MACRRMATTVVGVVSRAGGSPLTAGRLSSSAVGRLPDVSSKIQSSLFSVRYFCGKPSTQPHLFEENKELLRLVKEMMEGSLKMQKDAHKAVLVEIKGLSDQQSEHARTVKCLALFIVLVVGAVEATASRVKTQSAQVVENLASHAEEIVADLVAALIHGINQPSLLGKGKPFSWNEDWVNVKRIKIKSLDDALARVAKMKEDLMILEKLPPLVEPEHILLREMVKDLIEEAARKDVTLDDLGAKFLKIQEMLKKSEELKNRKKAEEGMEKPSSWLVRLGLKQEHVDEPEPVEKKPGMEEPGTVKTPGQEQYKETEPEAPEKVEEKPSWLVRLGLRLGLKKQHVDEPEPVEKNPVMEEPRTVKTPGQVKETELEAPEKGVEKPSWLVRLGLKKMHVDEPEPVEKKPGMEKPGTLKEEPGTVKTPQ